MSSLDSSNPNIILTGVLLAASITAVIAFTADRLVVFDIVGPTRWPYRTPRLPMEAGGSHHHGSYFGLDWVRVTQSFCLDHHFPGPTGTTEIPAAVPLVQLGHAGRKWQLRSAARLADSSFL